MTEKREQYNIEHRQGDIEIIDDKTVSIFHNEMLHILTIDEINKSLELSMQWIDLLKSAMIWLRCNYKMHNGFCYTNTTKLLNFDDVDDNYVK